LIHRSKNSIISEDKCHIVKRDGGKGQKSVTYYLNGP
jgi:hypothetical protein